MQFYISRNWIVYLKRYLERVIKEASKTFRVILLTGPRQVGKTTLLQHIEPDARSYVSLDDLNNRLLAQEDPKGFIDRLSLPVLIDEIQYAPSLLSYIKLAVDKLKKPGLFWLTGSQQFDMMKNVSESLAGRVAVFQLQGISLSEEQGQLDNTPFLPDLETVRFKQRHTKLLTLTEIYYRIWRGSYPEVVTHEGKNWERYYESYLTTYIQRDIRDYLNVNNPMTFHKFMQIVAARTGQLINYKEIARDVGVSEPTIKTWLQALQASGIIYLLQPYFNNQTKRLIKTPKLYFMDTGLCCFLTGWLTPIVLERGAMAGNLLEPYAVSEIIKSYLNQGKTPIPYFYRYKEKREIDLLIESNVVLYPV